MAEQKINYSELTIDYEFEPTNFRLSDESVLEYLNATKGNRHIYKKNNIVPPMSIAALAFAAILAGLSMPPGTVHISQDLQFLNPVAFNENVTSHARVNRIVQRGKFHMIAIGINVVNEKNLLALTGETSFILPSG